MKTIIRVESGIAAGTEHEICKGVTRIGSATSADICIPSSEIPSIAISMECRAGTYRIYNRANRVIKIGNQPVQPGQAEIWKNQQSLELAGGIKLRLLLDVETKPVTQVEYEFDEFEEDESSQEESLGKRRTPTNSKTIKQVLLLLVCAAVLVGATFESFEMPNSGLEKSFFSKICHQANQAESKLPPQILPKLRYAEAAHIRGDKVMASLVFSSLYDELVEMKPAFLDKKNNSLELAILSYVEERVANTE